MGLFNKKYEPKQSAFVSDGKSELNECNLNRLKSCILWWLITSYHAVFKLCSVLHQVLIRSLYHLSITLLVLSWIFLFVYLFVFFFFLHYLEKNGIHNSTEIQRFFFLLCTLLSSFQQEGKQLLLRAKFIFEMNCFFDWKNCEKMQW